MSNRSCRRRRRWIGLVLFCMGALACACRGDPGAAAQAAIARGERYATAGQLEAAVVEFRYAIERQPDAAGTHHRLATLYERLGDHRHALEAYARVVALSDAYPDADLWIASEMIGAQRFDEAERLSRRALERNGRDVAAQLMNARALDKLGRQAAALKRLGEALAVAPTSASAHVLAGSWKLRDADVTGAREAFLRAIECDPRSPEAWTALGSLEWRLGNVREAERAFLKTLDLGEDKSAARRLIASFYIATGRSQEAEEHLRALAAASSTDKLGLVDYYLAVRRSSDAEPLLDELLRDTQLEPEARLRRAVIAHEAGQTSEAAAELSSAMQHATTEVRGHLIKSQWLFADGDLAGALMQAQRAEELAPRSPEASYTVGIVQFRRGDLEEAARALKRARKASKHPAVDVQLARVALARQDVNEAASYAESAAASAAGPLTYALLARVSRTSGNLDKARQIVADGLRRWKNAPELETERGYLELAARRPAAARVAFERALRSIPRSAANQYGLIAAQLAEGHPDAARATAEAWRNAAPDDVQLAILSARVDLAQGRTSAAQKTLEELVRRSPGEGDALEALAQLYVATQQLAAAATQYERVAELRVRPAGALTMVGMLRQQLHDNAGARNAYERALASDTHAGVAANNLAWLEAGDNRFEEALKWARQAERDLHGAPQALDTLGWMSHLSGNEPEAVRLLTAACDKAPRNPAYHYHLGAAYLTFGRRLEGRASLQEALKLSDSFEGAEEARKLLENTGSS